MLRMMAYFAKATSMCMLRPGNACPVWKLSRYRRPEICLNRGESGVPETERSDLEAEIRYLQSNIPEARRETPVIMPENEIEKREKKVYLLFKCDEIRFRRRLCSSIAGAYSTAVDFHPVSEYYPKHLRTPSSPGPIPSPKIPVLRSNGLSPEKTHAHDRHGVSL